MELEFIIPMNHLCFSGTSVVLVEEIVIYVEIVGQDFWGTKEN